MCFVCVFVVYCGITGFISDLSFTQNTIQKYPSVNLEADPTNTRHNRFRKSKMVRMPCFFFALVFPLKTATKCHFILFPSQIVTESQYHALFTVLVFLILFVCVFVLCLVAPFHTKHFFCSIFVLFSVRIYVCECLCLSFM